MLYQSFFLLECAAAITDVCNVHANRKHCCCSMYAFSWNGFSYVELFWSWWSEAVWLLVDMGIYYKNESWRSFSSQIVVIVAWLSSCLLRNLWIVCCESWYWWIDLHFIFSMLAAIWKNFRKLLKIQRQTWVWYWEKDQNEPWGMLTFLDWLLTDYCCWGSSFCFLRFGWGRRTNFSKLFPIWWVNSLSINILFALFSLWQLLFFIVW